MNESVTPSDEPERWLPVAGYEGMYEVSDQGRVRSLPRFHAGGRVLKPGTSGPRAMVGLCRDGRSRTFAVHILVARAFLGPCPDGQEVCHGPAGRWDNRLVNLSYGTPSKNNGEDKRRDGTLPVGVLNPRAILTEEIVRECRIRVAAGESRRALAREFDVSDTVIRKAVAGIAWRHVVQPPPLPPDSKSRPAQAGEMPVVTARWEASLLRAARLHAENKGLTLSDVVRQAVTDYLEKNSDDPNPLRQVYKEVPYGR